MTEFTVTPYVVCPPHEDAWDAFQAALEADDRVLGPVVSYDYEEGQLSAVFQVDDGQSFTHSIAVAIAVFEGALRAAGIDAPLAGVTITV